MAKRRAKRDIKSNLKNWMKGSLSIDSLVSDHNIRNNTTSPWSGVAIDYFDGLHRWDYHRQKTMVILPVDMIDWRFVHEYTDFDLFAELTLDED